MGGDPENLSKVADVLYEAAREKEPQVTTDLKDIADRLSGSMVGLEYRLKTRGSIGKKIRRKSGGRRTAEQVASRLHDVLRYTYVSDLDEHALEVAEFFEEVRRRGYSENDDDIENNWAEGNDYYGINLNAATPDGYIFELQFHTLDSWRAKMQNHPLYEERRQPGTTDERAAELTGEMKANLREVEFPLGIEQIGRIVYR